MKKIFTNSKQALAGLFVAGALMISGSADAQSFKIGPSKLIQMEYNLEAADHEIYGYVENISNANINLKWERISNNFDDMKWDYSLCDNVNCYFGIPDSSSMAVITPNEKAPLKILLSLDPTKSTVGLGTIKLLVYDINNPQDADTITFVANVMTTGINDLTSSNVQISIYPNPATDVLNIVAPSLNLGNGSISIYNSIGAKVEETKLSSDNINTLSLNALPAGVYYIRFNGTAGEVATRSFIKK